MKTRPDTIIRLTRHGVLSKVKDGDLGERDSWVEGRKGVRTREKEGEEKF